MIKVNKYFVDTLNEILFDGEYVKGEVRTKWSDGTPATYKMLTNKVYDYDLSKGEFPLLTLRKQAVKSAIKEILWIYQDQSNDLSLLKEKYNIHWWDNWNIGDGTIGNRYGHTVKRYDLINKLIDKLKNNPNDRRMIIDMFQYEELESSDGLAPCAYSTTWNVRGEYLDVILNQRSSDFLVAWSINALQYVALQMMIAKATGYKVGKFLHVIGNVHIYDRHLHQVDSVKEILYQASIDENEKQPKIILDTDKTNFYDFTIDDFKIEDYEPKNIKIDLELAI